MVRIYKEFNLALHSKQHVQKRAVFSSYPGELSSDDDFYISDTGLALLQTTNDVLDTELYKLLTPLSVLNWQRVRCSCSPHPNKTLYTCIQSRTFCKCMQPTSTPNLYIA